MRNGIHKFSVEMVMHDDKSQVDRGETHEFGSSLGSFELAKQPRATCFRNEVNHSMLQNTS